MLRRPTRRRSGFSLVEVLVALFIVAAGLIALLSLFPLGAVQMGHAMRADRSGQCAMQADGKLRYGWRRGVTEPLPFIYSESPYFPNLSDAMPAASGPPVSGAVPSYPVLFDPIGSTSYSTPRRDWVAGQVNGIRRAMPFYFGFNGSVATGTNWSLPEAIQYCTLPDDLEFAPDGTPADRDGTAVTASGQPIFHHGRYTWAALLQRPDNTVPVVCGLKVLVFDRRPSGVDSLEAERTFGPIAVAVGDTVVDLPAPIDTVPLRVGGWLFDGTVISPGGTSTFVNPTPGTGIRNGNFYRVRSIADVGGTTTRVELDTPIGRPTGSPATTAYDARFYVFADLIEVYDRPNLVPSGYQKQTP